MGESIPLGELVTIQRGTTYKSALLGRPGPILLGLASIARHGGFRSDSLKTYGGDSQPSLLVKPGEIYASLKDVTQSADLLGSVARLPFDGPTGRLTQDTVRLDIVSHLITSDFLHWSLRTPNYRSYCHAHATGTTTLGLPRGDFLAYPIWVPPVSQQRRIAGVLGALDDLIDTNERLSEDLRRLVRNTFLQLLGAPCAAVPASMVMDLRYGKSLPARDRRPGPFPVVSSAGIIGSHDSAFVKGPGIVVGRKGTVGSVTWVQGDFFPIDTSFYVTTELPILFAFLSIERMGLSSMNTDSAVPGLNRENALSQPIRVPSDKALARFDDEASILWSAAQELTEESLVLKQTRDELLPLLMSGKIRVRDLESA